MLVLIVEDDKSLARLLQQTMREAGYDAHIEYNGLSALERATTTPFDLILLDGMLPGLDGLTVCRRLRAAAVPSPVLMITARDTVENKVAGLDSGADDYIVKLVAIRELLARVRALLRRSAPISPVLHAGDLTLNTASRQAFHGEAALTLSPTEFSLLEYLMRNKGRVLTRAAILLHVWQYDFNGNDNILDVYIGYLRGKLNRERPCTLIRTVRGVGFCLDAADAV